MEVIVATQWEYCALVSVKKGYDGWLIGNPKYKPSERNFKPFVQDLHNSGRVKFDGDDPDKFAEVVCDLGLNGWELVSVDQGIMYVKRPK